MMVCHAWEQQNVHNHASIWNKHQYIFLACKEHVSIYLCFSVCLAPPLRFEAHMLTPLSAVCQWAVLVWKCHLCSHHQIHPGGCPHTMPCLFISAWHMAMMLIDFIKPTPKLCLTLPSLRSSHPLHPPTKSSASLHSSSLPHEQSLVVTCTNFSF